MFRRCFPILLALAIPAATYAQADFTAPAPGAWVDGSSGDKVFFNQRVAFAGGDVRFEGAPVKGAPYSAEAITETVQSLADGNSIRRENRTLIQRDSEGRTRREETLEAIGPWSTGAPHKMIFINDPVAKVQYILNPAEKTGDRIPLPDMATFGEFAPGEHGVHSTVAVRVQRKEVRAGGAPPDAHESRSVIKREVAVLEAMGAPNVPYSRSADAPAEEKLGNQLIEGLDCEGTKFTTVLAADKIGADRDIEIVFERWTSSELGVDVMTKRSDPRFGVTTYRLTNVNRAEPLPSAFEPSADYEITGSEGFIMRRDLKQ